MLLCIFSLVCHHSQLLHHPLSAHFDWLNAHNIDWDWFHIDIYAVWLKLYNFLLWIKEWMNTHKSHLCAERLHTLTFSWLWSFTPYSNINILTSFCYLYYFQNRSKLSCLFTLSYLFHTELFLEMLFFLVKSSFSNSQIINHHRRNLWEV